MKTKILVALLMIVAFRVKASDKKDAAEALMSLSKIPDLVIARAIIEPSYKSTDKLLEKYGALTPEGQRKAAQELIGAKKKEELEDLRTIFVACNGRMSTETLKPNNESSSYESLHAYNLFISEWDIKLLRIKPLLEELNGKAGKVFAAYIETSESADEKLTRETSEASLPLSEVLDDTIKKTLENLKTVEDSDRKEEAKGKEQKR